MRNSYKATKPTSGFQGGSRPSPALPAPHGRELTVPSSPRRLTGELLPWAQKAPNRRFFRTGGRQL